jgi:DNA-binding response OmpR family regulator
VALNTAPLDQALLTKDKHTVGVAKSSEEALAKIEAATFDVVIVNFALSGVSGVETAKAIRAREAAAPPGLST